MFKINIDMLQMELDKLKLVKNNIKDIHNSESLYKTKDGEKVRVVQANGKWYISSNIGNLT